MIAVEVHVCLGPRAVQSWVQHLAVGTTLGQAAEAALARVQQEPAQHACSLPNWQWGVWGRVLPPEHVLQDGDRVEAYRELLVDPKVARRERFAKQGARGAGLFSKRRDNAKPGY
ncbi:RnfH family protein [Lampropedia puyangensis]|uniref:UPF0125 protein E9531_07470 n=2 Tax=Lampropedia puyangensis TaxID=1330072 RepID=A0A4S8FA97_9BURK|nr:RnfH family protein [Lampropedia puyangensis]